MKTKEGMTLGALLLRVPQSQRADWGVSGNFRRNTLYNRNRRTKQSLYSVTFSTMLFNSSVPLAVSCDMIDDSGKEGFECFGDVAIDFG